MDLGRDAREAIDAYLEVCRCMRNLSESTVAAYHGDLNRFADWLGLRGIDILAVDRAIVHEYLVHCHESGLGAHSSARMLACLRGFYRQLCHEKLIEHNPVAAVHGPKARRALPKTLSEREVELLLESPPDDSPMGLRDRAMLEVLYACGLRVSELIGLGMHNINLQQGVIRIAGKGGRERLVPMGETAIKWVKRYLAQGRAALAGKAHLSDAVFLSRRGSPMTRQAFWHNIKKYARIAGIPRPLSPHVVRHAFATHMVNHGADLRVVQMLLGHSSLNTTQIYTHVAEVRLKEVHRKYHLRG